MGRLGFSASKATAPSRPWLQAVTGSDKRVSITGEETVSSAIHEDLRESLSQEYRSPRNTNTVARAIDIANANILAWQPLPQDPSELRSVLSAPWCSAKLACFVFSALLVSHALQPIDLFPSDMNMPSSFPSQDPACSSFCFPTTSHLCLPPHTESLRRYHSLTERLLDRPPSSLSHCPIRLLLSSHTLCPSDYFIYLSAQLHVFCSPKCDSKLLMGNESLIFSHCNSTTNMEGCP